MQTEQVILLLKQKDIIIREQENVVFHDNRLDMNIPLENHYGLVKSDNEQWNFCFIELERRNTPEFKIEKSFKSKEEALKFFFLNRIYRYYMDKYVIPSRDYSIKRWNINTVIETMKKNNIPLCYLSYGNINNANSIYYYCANDEWCSAYIGKSNEIIAKNTKDSHSKDKDWFFSLCLNSIYPLYLLDKYESELLKKNEISAPFSDIDRARFIGYNI